MRYAAYLGIGLLAFHWLSHKTAGPEVGSVAADFSLPVAGATGDEFRLSAQRGTPVVIEVVASWCEMCRRSAPTLIQASRATRTKDVRFVAVSLDNNITTARQLKQQWGIPYPVVHDTGSFSRAYQVGLLPTTIVVDGEGQVARVKAGAVSTAELEQWLADLGAPRI